MSDLCIHDLHPVGFAVVFENVPMLKKIDVQ